MVKILVNDTSLSSIGDSIRAAKGEDKYLKFNYEITISEKDKYFKVPVINCYNYEQIISCTWRSEFQTAARVIYYLGREDENGEYVYIGTSGAPGTYTSAGSANDTTNIKNCFNNRKEYFADDVYLWVLTDYNNPITLRIETTILTDELNPATNYLPSEMAGEIDKLGELTVPKSALELAGDCSYKFYNGASDWLIERFGDKITTKNITNCDYMFSNCKLDNIPFDINISSAGSISINAIFQGANFKTVPYIKGGNPYSLYQVFNDMKYIREIPNDWADYIDWSYIRNSSNVQFYGYIANNYSLRYVPQNLIAQAYCKGTSSTFTPYYYCFQYCYTLDELSDYPVQKNTSNITSNVMSNFLRACYRLKHFTFALGEDGQPQVWMAKNQTLDLSLSIGFAENTETHYMVNYNSGITIDKAVCLENGNYLSTLEEVQARYNELKDDPDWFAISNKQVNYNGANVYLAVLFSRYNHTSAVETINSLPDTSATGTNTIKFKNYAGACTDGGGINDLTAEEIAVAAAKGWTVSIVN